ncbi:MAG: universal stress protein [Balneola sp.]
MSFPSNWLIATNGSKYASEAVKHAGMLSALLKNKPTVTILVVADDKKSEDTAKGIVEMAKFLFEEHSGPEMDPELVVEIGNPGKMIIKTANKLGCDQILIGGADFKWDINDGKPGGISNYIIEKFNGVITVVK